MDWHAPVFNWIIETPDKGELYRAAPLDVNKPVLVPICEAISLIV
jgi:hypothetical protein